MIYTPVWQAIGAILFTAIIFAVMYNYHTSSKGDDYA